MDSFNISRVVYLKPYAPPPPTPLLRSCACLPIQSRTLYLSCMLLEQGPKGKPIYIREWERDLQHEFTELQLDRLYRLTHSSSVDMKMRENGFKVMTKWYRVPTKLAKIYPTSSDACWRDCGHRGLFLHIWWDCPKLQPYWQDIRTQINLILNIDLPDSPMGFLLHVPTISLSLYRKLVLPKWGQEIDPHLLEKQTSSKLRVMDQSCERY